MSYSASEFKHYNQDGASKNCLIVIIYGLVWCSGYEAELCKWGGPQFESCV